MLLAPIHTCAKFCEVSRTRFKFSYLGFYHQIYITQHKGSFYENKKMTAVKFEKNNFFRKQLKNGSKKGPSGDGKHHGWGRVQHFYW